jgi:hypothetical protein
MAVDLIVANYDEGDLATIEELFTCENDINEKHGIGHSIRTLFQNIRPPGIEDALLVVYEFGPCAMCREFIVHDMLKADLLPESIVAECRFDANPDIRQMAFERDDQNR